MSMGATLMSVGATLMSVVHAATQDRVITEGHAGVCSVLPSEAMVTSMTCAVAEGCVDGCLWSVLPTETILSLWHMLTSETTRPLSHLEGQSAGS